MQRRIEVIRSGRRGLCASSWEARELGRRVEKAARALGIEAQPVAAVTLNLVDLGQMSALHLEWMGERGPTDVLSIPAAAPFAPGPAPDEELREYDSPRGGDIALCWPWIVAQARSGAARNPLHEATVLAVHGLVHLRGYDHHCSFAARDMHRVERKLLQRLGVADLPRPYAN